VVPLSGKRHGRLAAKTAQQTDSLLLW
jgi:hypothetical protein